MKRWILLLIGIVMLLGLTACISVPAGNDSEVSIPAGNDPEVSIPEETCDLVYDMQAYDFFSEIFEEKSADEWTSMGCYTMLLKGLHTPVVVNMDGMDVLSVKAYDQTVELGTAGAVFEEECPVSIQGAENAVVVNISRDYRGETLIFTEGRCYKFQPEGTISTQVFVQEDGTFRYRRYWGEYVTSFEQWDTAPLELCTSREHFLYETGSAEIRNGEVVLTPENTVTVSDEYDLDTMFAEAKASGAFEGYETVDALLAANQAKASET